MPSISFYDPATGRFSGWLEGPEVILNINKQDRHWIDGRYDELTHYVVAGQAVDRPENPAMLSGHTLLSLPVPCKIHIGGAQYDCAESTAELTFDQPGIYAVRVDAWPYIDAEFTVENPAQ